MNLGELRLKALQSLKRPYKATESTESTESAEKLEQDKTLTNTLEAVEKEEGELTETEAENENELENETETESTVNSENSDFLNVKPFDFPVKRPRYQFNQYNNNDRNREYSDETDSDDENNFNLDSLLSLKANILYRMDESQSLLTATEERQQDLRDQLRECRIIQRKCEQERFRLERKLERLVKRIRLKELMKDEKDKEVSKTNFKKSFVGKMLKETYLRSINDRFRFSQLYRIYCDTLKIDLAAFSFNHKRIDPQIPFCSTELRDGKCPFARETCSMQHIETLQYETVNQVLKDYNPTSKVSLIESKDPNELIRIILKK